MRISISSKAREERKKVRQRARRSHLMSYCKGGVVVCFNSGTLQEGQLSFHGDQTSNISTDQTKKKRSTFLGIDQRTEIIF